MGLLPHSAVHSVLTLSGASCYMSSSMTLFLVVGLFLLINVRGVTMLTWMLMMACSLIDGIWLLFDATILAKRRG